MNQQNPSNIAPNPFPAVNGVRYQDLPLEELIRRIAEDIDPDAHDYFSHKCTPFHDSEGKSICLSTYLVDFLKYKLYYSGKNKFHLAHDLTLDKFFYSPQLYPQNEEQYENKNRVDCMNYYKPLLKKIRDSLAKKRGLTHMSGRYWSRARSRTSSITIVIYPLRRPSADYSPSLRAIAGM